MTSLDVTTQAGILDLLSDLVMEMNSAVIYISHNLGVIANLCDRVGVLYAGEIMEEADAKQIFYASCHPYTRGLLDSVPKLGYRKNQGALDSIPVQISNPDARPAGCVFVDRCPVEIPECRNRPELGSVSVSHKSRCHRSEEIIKRELNLKDMFSNPLPIDKQPEGSNNDRQLLKVDNLLVQFGSNTLFPLRI